MSEPNLILLHPPSVFKFRENSVFFGPVGDVIPSSSLFEIYPIGFLTISKHLHSRGLSVRIINLAMKMMRDSSFDPDAFIAKLDTDAFGIDLHWLTHADGCLSLAEMIKKHHPDIPVILGGLSATYYSSEIMKEYPFVDFIVRGDSTEEPVRLLMEAIKRGNGYKTVPNLVWRGSAGSVIVNEDYFAPENIDYIDYDYAHLMKMAIKYRDPFGYMPFKGWLRYPVAAVISCRGCYHNCGSCGGSLSAFKKVCMRNKPTFRSPELLAEDIRRISGLTGAPVMLLGDILQDGEDYADRFLSAVREYRIENDIAIEFFRPPDEKIIHKVSRSIMNFNVEMSPESHDQNARGAFGKNYSNDDLERSIELLIKYGCKRIDLFFMIGLPFQDYVSVMDTADYCDELLKKFDHSGKLLPMIAPLAPFIDPGSKIFEEPEKSGYTLFYKTLEEHRNAMLMTNWKYTLNYETMWMSRGEIVKATYDSAERLLDAKARHGIIAQQRAELIKDRIQRSRDLIEKMDSPVDLDDHLISEIKTLNELTSVCDKRELEWPVKKLNLSLMGMARLVLRWIY
jgi:B12-binding domain/radical SAM domain protein